MERVEGRISIFRYACPFCGESILRFAHDVPARWRCESCKASVTRSTSPCDEEFVIALSLLVGDDISVESISEEYD
jgi:ribosomal protein L37AE/L43A